jgi:heme exporter protein CcmD
MTMGATAHIDFIAAAYVAAVIVIGALIAWVTLDFRALQKILARLEMQGVTRRSASSHADLAVEPSAGKSGEKAKQRA